MRSNIPRGCCGPFWIDGKDLPSLPLTERKQLLREIVPGQPSVMLYASHVETVIFVLREMKRNGKVIGMRIRNRKMPTRQVASRFHELLRRPIDNRPQVHQPALQAKACVTGPAPAR